MNSGGWYDMHALVKFHVMYKHTIWTFKKLDGIGWAVIDGYGSACCDPDLWPFDPKKYNQYVFSARNMWPDFGEIRYRSHLFFWVSACCHLDLGPQNLISTSMNQNTSVTKIEQNSFHWFLRYNDHKVSRSLPAATLTFDPKIAHLWIQIHLSTVLTVAKAYKIWNVNIN